MIQSVKEQLIPFLKVNESQYVADGVSSQLGIIFNKLNRIFTGSITLGFSKTTAQKMVYKVSKSNEERFNKSLENVTGINLGGIIQSEKLEDFIEVSVNKNVSLIKSLPEEYFKQIETIVTNGIVNGERYNTIAKKIAETTKSKVTGRIKTIARNEVSTLNSQLTLRRSEALGITRGIFQTSDDERVRPCHAELDGVEFRLSRGAWSKKCQKWIIPGVTDINCRCSYSPIIEV